MYINILIGIVVISITISIQGIGTWFWINTLRTKFVEVPKGSPPIRTFPLLIHTGSLVLILHFMEAAIWATTYYFLPNIEEFSTFEEAMYFSLVTFTTLGYGDITISSAHRILAGFEAINGILLIGWSTTLMFTTVQHILKQDINSSSK